MKIDIKNKTQATYKDLMVIALVVNALALVMHLVLNIFTAQALIPVITTQFIFILLPIMYLAEDDKKNKEVGGR